MIVVFEVKTRWRGSKTPFALSWALCSFRQRNSWRNSLILVWYSSIFISIWNFDFSSWSKLWRYCVSLAARFWWQISLKGELFRNWTRSNVSESILFEFVGVVVVCSWLDCAGPGFPFEFDWICSASRHVVQSWRNIVWILFPAVCSVHSSRVQPLIAVEVPRSTVDFL